jgi:hypothetical protein
MTLLERLRRFRAAFSALRRSGEPLRGVEAWRRNHVPLQLAYDGRCAECGKPKAMDIEHCPGRERPWHPPNNATRRCSHVNGPNYVPGCVICDPRFNGGHDRSQWS